MKASSSRDRAISQRQVERNKSRLSARFRPLTEASWLVAFVRASTVQGSITIGSSPSLLLGNSTDNSQIYNWPTGKARRRRKDGNLSACNR